MSRAYLITQALEAERTRRRRTENIRMRSLLRSLRTQARPLELSDTGFRAHYRLSKQLFIELCEELKPYIAQSQRRTKIPLECKVLTALSFYATGSYQKPVGMSYLHNLSQASVSQCIKEVTEALNNPEILRKYIKFPQNRQERQTIVNRFSEKFGFPGVLGCIDGTHVALVRPTDHEERFFNRKHYHSRNVQIICDSDLNILNIDATFGGAAHDAYIWRNSEINAHMQQLYHNGDSIWFLGDSGYPLRPWVLTPILNAEPGSAEDHYTKVHCQARNTVERCIGVLKARWRCLLSHRVLHYNHHIVAKIVNGCAVLHNIANRHRLPIPELAADDTQREASVNVPRQPYAEESQELEGGRRQRNLIVERLRRNRALFRQE